MSIPLEGPENLLEQLVGIDTQNPPGGEVQAAQLLQAVLADIGFEAATDIYAPGRANVIGKIDNGPGPVFAFNTHLDVVPCGEGWNHAPLRLTREGDRLYGRGSNDAKGPLAAMVCACNRLAAARESWSGTLLAVFVGDEEVASEGAKHYAAGRPAVDLAVIGEPTSNNVVSAHKGSLRPRIRGARQDRPFRYARIGGQRYFSCRAAAVFFGGPCQGADRQAAPALRQQQLDSDPGGRRPCRQRCT